MKTYNWFLVEPHEIGPHAECAGCKCKIYPDDREPVMVEDTLFCTVDCAEEITGLELAGYED